MSKAVLISIHPQWCGKIASGEKTVEIRKTAPKIEPPFKCYIYCTKNPHLRFWAGPRYAYTDDHSHNAFDRSGNGKVIGEFVCARIDQIGKRGIGKNFDYCYLSLNVFGNDDIEVEITDIKKSCISKPQLNAYGTHSNCLFAWHISDLVLYPEPKELTDFFRICEEYQKGDPQCGGCDYYRPMGEYPPECDCDGVHYLYRPPQSWCYVEERK